MSQIGCFKQGRNSGSSRNFVQGAIKKFKLKKINKKRTLIYQVIDKKKKKKKEFLTISFYKFLTFELLYDSSL